MISECPKPWLTESQIYVGKDWHLEDFPFGYTLYTRQKGIISTPRRDHYLFGASRISSPTAELN